MSDEIDLRLYIATIVRRWWVVLLAVALALSASLVVSTRQPKRYQAEATLLAQPPVYQWRFEDDILPIVDTRRDYQRELAAMGRSNNIAQRAAELLQQSGVLTDVRPQDLRAAVNVRTGDGSTLIVTATADEPGKAAAIANAWAAGFIEQSQDIYLVGRDLQDFEAELQTASQRLAEASDALTEASTSSGLYTTASDSLEVVNSSSALQAQVDLLNQRLSEYHIDLASLRYLADRLAEAPSAADLRALPWELLDGPVLSQRGVLTSAEATSLLESPEALLAVIEKEEAALARTAEELAAQSEALQAELAGDWLAFDVAMREYVLARELYDLFSRKVDEAVIQGRIDPGLLLLVSEALPPSSPVQTRQLAQLAVAGVIGLIAGVLLALWLELRSQRRTVVPEQVHEDLKRAPAAK